MLARTALLTLVAAIAAACAEPPTSPTPAFSPEVESALQALAAAERWESRSVGEGIPSALWAHVEVLDAAGPDALRALGQSPSPVARAYAGLAMARHAATADGAWTLHADGAPLDVLYGCKGGQSTVRDVIWRDLPRPPAANPAEEALLVRVARESPDAALRQQAVAALVEAGHPLARELAR